MESFCNDFQGKATLVDQTVSGRKEENNQNQINTHHQEKENQQRSSNRGKKNSSSSRKDDATSNLSDTTTSINKKTLKPTKSKHESFVYVRVRPLLPTDTTGTVSSDSGGDNILPHLVIETTLSSSNENGTSEVDAVEGPLPIGGFTGILGTKETNPNVFHHAFLPRLGTVMMGGTSSLFCYGYTGAGKTHTTLGYGSEPGLYRLAAEELLRRVQDFNEKVNVGSKDDMKNSNDDAKEPLILVASVVEVYNDQVFDILSGRVPCSLRKNNKGQLVVRGATKKQHFSEDQIKDSGVDFAVVTPTLTTIQINSLKDLDDIHRMSLKHRVVGTSTEHCQSSRSHAIFRLDIVNASLLDVVNELEDAESIKPALQTAYDKQRTMNLRHRVKNLDEKIAQLNTKIEDMYACGVDRKSPFGGRLILVDLAGSDSDSRSIGENGHTAIQRKESQAINKSLLALKECIRGLQLQHQQQQSSKQSASHKKLPFRNSNMTRLLEEVLTPKKNRDSSSVMIVNVAPAKQLKTKTINSLRYGEMFSNKPRRKKTNRAGTRPNNAVKTYGESNRLAVAKRRIEKENKDVDTKNSCEGNVIW